MIRVIMGKKGTGKTKQMIDMINDAVQSEHGNVVCIEKGSKLTLISIIRSGWWTPASTTWPISPP